jgi:hypothetical protein
MRLEAAYPARPAAAPRAEAGRAREHVAPDVAGRGGLGPQAGPAHPDPLPAFLPPLPGTREQSLSFMLARPGRQPSWPGAAAAFGPASSAPATCKVLRDRLCAAAVQLRARAGGAQQGCPLREASPRQIGLGWRRLSPTQESDSDIRHVTAPLPASGRACLMPSSTSPACPYGRAATTAHGELQHVAGFDECGWICRTLFGLSSCRFLRTQQLQHVAGFDEVLLSAVGAGRPAGPRLHGPVCP